MAKITLRFPDEQTPGYLRFVKALPDIRAQAAALADAVRAGTLSTTQVDALVELMLVFIADPADRLQARDMILDASAADLVQAWTALADKL